MRILTMFLRTALALMGGGGWCLVILGWIIGHLAITTGVITPEDMSVMDRYSIAALWALVAHIGSLPPLGLAIVAWPHN